MRTFHWLLPLSVAASVSVMAQPGFFRQDISVGIFSDNVVRGDFNGDGRLDLAVSTPDPADLHYRVEFAILLSEGGGKFGHPIWTANHCGWSGWSGSAADFDGDGKDDLVTGDDYLHLSRGDGTFLPPLPIGDEHLFPLIAVGDLNHDGKPDVVQRGYGYGVRIWLGNGDGTFHAAPNLPVERVSQATVADLNQDGRNDLIMFGSRSEASDLLVFLGLGDGFFGPEIRTSIDFRGYRSVVADFNGDGLPDISLRTGIMLGNGDGTFQSPIPYEQSVMEPSYPTPLTAGDFNGDGQADLVTGYDAAIVSIRLARREGTFLPPAIYSVGWTPQEAAAVDLDGDGSLDLVTANGHSGTVSVLMSRSQGEPALPRAVSTASDTAIVAPGSLATLWVPTPTMGTGTTSPPWPTQLGGISLEVRDSGGVVRLAPLLFVSDSQINFQVPTDTALGEATLSIVSGDGTSEVGGMQVDAVAPSLFMASQRNAVPAATAMLVEHDGSQVPIPVYECGSSPATAECELLPIPLAAIGDRPLYLTFYGTGFRDADLENVTCFIDDLLVPVTYAGPQGTWPGFDQINVRVPPEVVQNSFFGGSIVILRVDGAMANTVRLLWYRLEL